MNYARYGKCGPEISRLGFGVMRLKLNPINEPDSGQLEASARLLRAAMAAGVNFFDTHHFYHDGRSETAIGMALKGWTGRRIYIQTKTPWYHDRPRAHFEKLLAEALEKLGVDKIDFLLHHSMNMNMWKQRGHAFLRFTDWAMKRGLIQSRGFSTHDTAENIRLFVDTGEFSVMLVSYNWMNPQLRDVIAYAADKGMGVSVMNPLGGGALAVGTNPIMRLLPGARSAAEIGLRYVLATPSVACVLSGMSTMAQLRANVATASRRVALTTAEDRFMRAQLNRLHQRARRFCAACGYCMPCPHGVDIPACFQLWNQAMLFGRVAWARERYATLKRTAKGDTSASACRQCGKCEPKCPTRVPIMRQLRQVEAKLSAISAGRR